MSKPSGPVGVVPNDAKTGPKGEPMTPVPSASLIILCPIKGTSSNRQNGQYATLMVQRSARAGGSFRSAVVFPGGLLDQADVYAIEQDAKRDEQKAPREKKAQYIDSLRLCALREAFEETGLLLIPATSSDAAVTRAIGPHEAGMTDAEWSTARTSVHDDARNFLPFIRHVMQRSSATTKNVKSLSVALQPLHHHSNWVTPRNMVRPAKRFDTHFFITVLDTPDALGQLSGANAAELRSGGSSQAGPAGSQAGPSMAAGLAADGSETTSLRLATPTQLMDLAVRDEIILYPPQFYLLADVHTTLLNARAGHPITFQPLYFGQEPDGLSDASLTTISSVEPQGRPGDGAMISRSQLRSTGGKHGGGQEESNDEDQVFVMPLALPGDALRPVRGQKDAEQKRNRVFVTLRSKGEGGGMMVHGSQRCGIDNLHDFEYGHILSQTNEDHHDDQDKTAKAKL